MKFQFEPLRQWPKDTPRTEPGKRKSSPFRAGYSQTLELLERELRMLRARSAALQVDISENMIRQDGLPYARARTGANDPGVVLSFETDDGHFMYPCDTYTRWEDNLRAIALTLEKLRAVDRYGVAQRGEQYAGWKAIPQDVDERVTPEEAARVIVRTAGVDFPDDIEPRVEAVLHDPSTFRRWYREAARRAHPDVQGGTAAHFQRVQRARDVLEAHHDREEVSVG